MKSFNFSPVGFLKCSTTYKQEAPRQSVEDSSENIGEILLKEGCDFEQALKGLEGFRRIWLVYEFHVNKQWKPLTETPRATRKQGVFATRSPYRPNPIGLSCVKLLSVEGLKIKVKEFDLLNGTPILDIKPYITGCDAFKVENNSWIESEELKKIIYSEKAKKELSWLESQGLFTLRRVLEDQLKRDPVNKSKKRVKFDEESKSYCFGCRTWRVFFQYKEDILECFIVSIETGYTRDDFKIIEDKYNDKKLHELFLKTFFKKAKKNFIQV